MMRTILFIHYDPECNGLYSLVKHIPYAPEDTELYFVDISPIDKEKLGVMELKYLNNHYADEQPYVWLNQPSHIASCSMPLKYMYIRLLRAMQIKFQKQQQLLGTMLADYDKQDQMWQRGDLPGFETTRMRGCSSVSGKWKILGKIHFFSVSTDRNAPATLCKMLRQVWLEMRKELVLLINLCRAAVLACNKKLE